MKWFSSTGDFVDELATAARSSGAEVELDRDFGSFRSDLVVASPSGSTYIVEVKAGKGSLHLGTVAQVSALAKAASDVLGPADVEGVLITTNQVKGGVREVAKRLGVRIIEADLGSERAGDVAISEILGAV